MRASDKQLDHYAKCDCCGEESPLLPTREAVIEWEKEHLRVKVETDGWHRASFQVGIKEVREDA